MHNPSSALRQRTESSAARDAAPHPAPSLLSPKKKLTLLNGSPRRNRNAILLAIAITVLSLLASVIVITMMNADEPDVLKHEESFTINDWKAILEKKAKQSAPPHEALGLSQVVFVSCNRHDRSQAYWGYVAAATQCEMLPTDARARSAPCRRLYSGRSPVITVAPASKNKRAKKTSLLSVSSADVVPLGGCGSVVDSRNALVYREAPKSDFWTTTMRSVWGLLRAKQMLYPAVHVTRGERQPGNLTTPPPVDALIWLGDAIYADKPADGKASQGFGHVKNSLETIRKMWLTQRNAPMYDAFRESCLWREGATLPVDARVEEEREAALHWVFSAVAEVGQRIAQLFAVEDGPLQEAHGNEAASNSSASTAEGSLRDGKSVESGATEKAHVAVVGDGAVPEDEREEKVLEEDAEQTSSSENSSPWGEEDDAAVPDEGDAGFGVDAVEVILEGILGNDREGEEVDPEAENARRRVDQVEHDEEDLIGNALLNYFPGAEEDAVSSVEDLAEYQEESNAEEGSLEQVGSPTRPSAPAAKGASLGGRANVYGTWDDHDMGENDGGKEYPDKNATQRFFLDFLKAPPTDPRWTREGVYAFHTMGFHDVFMGEHITTAAVFGGNTSDDAQLRRMQAVVAASLAEVYKHAVCLVLLDVRTFRDRPTAAHAGDMLGEEQWEWLEERIVNDIGRDASGRERCALTLVGGGIQLIADEKTAENWAAFPRSRDRLFGLFKAHQVERVAFLTGDVHMGELAADFSKRTVDHVLGYPIVEATSSGLTHSAAVFPGVATILRAMFVSPRRRVGRLHVERNFGTVRLSLDGAQAMEQLGDMKAALATMKQQATQSSSERERKARQRLQSIVQSVVNATFTIFSIPKKGKPVLRLNFPLALLTYEGSQRYVDAKVTPKRGYVYRQLPTGPVPAQSQADVEEPLPAEELLEITTYFPRGTRRVARYPNNGAPPFTAYIRFMQATFFPRHSISETIGALIRIHLYGAAVVAVGVLVYFWWRMKRWWRGCRPAKRTYPIGQRPLFTGSPITKDEFASVVSIVNFVMGKEEKEKGG